MNKIIRSRLLRWLLYTGIFFLLLMTALRLAIFMAFHQMHLTWTESVQSFILGIRFDVRAVSILLLLMLIFGSIRFFNPFDRKGVRKIWWLKLGFVAFVFTFFYIADFIHYAYLSQRLNASALNFLQDAGISAKMLWQSYPVIKLLILLAISTAIVLWVIKRLYRKASTPVVVMKKRERVIGFIIAFLILAVGIFGRIGQFPLRWSYAFSMGNDNKAALSLNPFQSFFSTLKFRSSTYNLAKTKQYYSLMAAHLGVQKPDSEKLDYLRTHSAKNNFNEIKPNIVVVICESFSGYKSSMWGNPLNTTPYFNEMCKNGIFFNHCFTPTYGTARGVWATITGIPDVEMPTTASRNMAMVSQNTIINDFVDYKKLYFIGGSATWANIRGLLMNNIDSLHLYEGDDYQAKKIDVWGISDKNLFLESNKVLKKQAQPFFAVIQTADNHRPYTIPSEDQAAFKKVNYPADTLRKYGFESNEEMNAFRYTDFGFETFIETAKKENYFNNTIFIFVGDHGIRGNAMDMFPRAWTDQSLTAVHVPLLFYSPSLLKPQLKTETCSQIDILPSAASLANQSYHNYTLGRNLFDSAFAADTSQIRQCAFFIDPDNRQIGLIGNDYYYTHGISSDKEEFVSVKSNNPIGKTAAEQKIKSQMRQLTDAYFETAKYLLFNNKRNK